VTQLQRLFFRHWPQLKDLALSNCAAVDKRDALRRELGALADDELARLVCRQLRLASESDPWAARREFLEEVVVSAYERRRGQRAAINAMPLYPSEAVLWDEAQVGWGGGWRDGCCVGEVWCGAVWCGVVWCGVVWCGVVWCGVCALCALCVC
jgi:hypothetical protein